jgi:phosphopantetheine--protein transferase-like protein
VPLLGVGIDVVEVARVTLLLERYGATFERRWFAPAESLWARRAGRLEEGLSALLAGKEAVWKSLRVAGSGPVPWRSIHVLPDGTGGKVTLPDGLAPEATEVRVDVTLGHRVALACAFAWSDSSSRPMYR